MAKLKPKTPEDGFDAIQWKGFVPTDGFRLDEIHQESYDVISNSIEYIMGFEKWVKKHIKGKKFKYRGNNLVMIDEWGEAVLTPGMWIIMVPDDETSIPMPNFMTDEQVKSYYNEIGL